MHRIACDHLECSPPRDYPAAVSCRLQVTSVSQRLEQRRGISSRADLAKKVPQHAATVPGTSWLTVVFLMRVLTKKRGTPRSTGFRGPGSVCNTHIDPLLLLARRPGEFGGQCTAVDRGGEFILVQPLR